MIDVLNGTFMVLTKIINKIFNYEIPFIENETIKFGYLIVAWLIILLLIFYITRIFKEKKGE